MGTRERPAVTPRIASINKRGLFVPGKGGGEGSVACRVIATSGFIHGVPRYPGARSNLGAEGRGGGGVGVATSSSGESLGQLSRAGKIDIVRAAIVFFVLFFCFCFFFKGRRVPRIPFLALSAHWRTGK
jgi:hypothetical protein